MIERVTVGKCTCERCGETWIPRTCPKCRNPGWNSAKGRGRPKKAIETIPPEPEIPEEMIEELAPIESQSVAKAPTIIPARHSPPEKQPKKKKEARMSPGGKMLNCPHGFLMLESGYTACPDCKGIGR